MKFFKAFVLFSFLLLSTLSIAQDKYDGLWTGTLSASGMEVQIDFEINEAEQKALISIPMQKVKDIESGEFSIKGDKLSIVYPSFRVRYDGIYDESLKEFVGEWKQGMALPLNLKRTDKKTSVNRPQTPVEPYPYDVADIIVENTAAKKVKLAGTLTTPKGDGPFPLAIMISGSGRQNRNSEILGHQPFLVIADYLTRAGIAVLRYDDRGVGLSSGSHTKATSVDFATDATAMYNYAKTLNKIDKNKIGIIGHSEGGMIAPLLASENEDLGYIISLAGPAVPIADLMTNQNVQVMEQMGMSKKGLEITNTSLPMIYSIVNQDKEPKELFDTLVQSVHGFYDALPEEDQKLLAPNKASYYMQLSQAFFSPWFRYFLAYDPTDSWQKTKCPVLAINGSEDIQVDAKMNTNAIISNLAIAGNMNAKVKILPGLNHLFQPCNKCNLAEYATIEKTFDEGALELMKAFILEMK